MSYKYFSNTSSGWTISVDLKADPDKRWRAVHPMYGERFFDAHYKILEYTVEHMLQQFERFRQSPDAAMLVSALCLHCGGKWLVSGEHDPSVLEGVCMDCQAGSDNEKPLLFMNLLVADAKIRPNLPELPRAWLVS